MTGREKQRAASSVTRTVIAEAAAQEFLLHGYAGASLSRIGDRLGLTKGALVYHFRAKADFATYFIDVVREATGQADRFARTEYPDCGSRRLLLHFMLMGAWRASDPKFAAGMALFADRASPAFEADDVIRGWLNLSVDAFESCQARGIFQGGFSALEAAEMFLVTNLGAVFFGKHVRLDEPGTIPLRFTRLGLAAVGVPDVDTHAEEVIRTYKSRLPPLDIVTHA